MSLLIVSMYKGNHLGWRPTLSPQARLCQGVEGLVDLGLLDEEVRKRVPNGMMLCESATQNQGGQMKATGKATRKKAKT